MGKEKFDEEKKKEEMMKGSISGKTFGQDPKMMIARSASSRSHASIRQGGKKSNASEDDERKKRELDALNLKVE